MKKRGLLLSSLLFGAALLILTKKGAGKLSRTGDSDEIVTEHILRVIDRAGLPRSTLKVSVRDGHAIVSGPLSLPGLNALLQQVISVPGVMGITRRHLRQR